MYDKEPNSFFTLNSIIKVNPQIQSNISTSIAILFENLSLINPNA